MYLKDNSLFKLGVVIICLTVVFMTADVVSGVKDAKSQKCDELILEIQGIDSELSQREISDIKERVNGCKDIRGYSYKIISGGDRSWGCEADFNNDLVVNVFDLQIMLMFWEFPGSPIDLTQDGVVNVFDLLDLLSSWGECGPIPLLIWLHSFTPEDGEVLPAGEEIIFEAETNTPVYGMTLILHTQGGDAVNHSMEMLDNQRFGVYTIPNPQEGEYRYSVWAGGQGRGNQTAYRSFEVVDVSR